MNEDDQLRPVGTTRSGSRLRQAFPVALLCGLLLAAALNTVGGKKDQSFEGVVVMDLPHYKFYPKINDCNLEGTPYWLVPNQRFHDVVSMPSTNDFNHLNRLLHATWRVKLHGNLSHLGRYGFQGKYWRELDVLYVIDATALDCNDEVVRTNP